MAIGGLAVAFAWVTGENSGLVLFSGQSALPGLLENSATFLVGTLVLLVIAKGLAYGLSLSSLRGGPTFPGMFIGATGGIALSHLPGLPMVARRRRLHRAAGRQMIEEDLLLASLNASARSLRTCTLRPFPALTFFPSAISLSPLSEAARA